MRLSINQKLRGGFSVAILVALALGAIGYLELGSQVDSFEKILKEDYHSVSLSRELEIGVLQCRRAEKDFFLSIGTLEAQAHYLERFKEVSSALYDKAVRFAVLAAADSDQEINSVRQSVTGLPQVCQESTWAFLEIVAQVQANPNLTARQSNALMDKHKANMHLMESSVKQAITEARFTQGLMLALVSWAY